MSNTVRITQFDGLRAIAIGAVFLHHAYKAKMLWMGVDIFFVLSGFLITGILFRQKQLLSLGGYIGHFYERRAKRILPAYLAILILTAVLFGTGWLSHWYFYIGGMNFLQPLKIPSPKTLEVLWSLAVEEQFYLLWPFAVFFLSRRQLIWLCAVLMLCAPVLRYLCSPLFSTPWSIYMGLPFRMDCLVAGALFVLIQDRLVPGRAWYGWLGTIPIALALVSLVLLGRHGISKGGNEPLGNFAIYELTLIISVSIFWMVWNGIGKRLLSSWPMVALGTISFSIYLVHTTMLSLLPHKLVIVAALLSITYAALMWVFVENPILRGSFQWQTKPKAEEASIAAGV